MLHFERLHCHAALLQQFAFAVGPKHQIKWPRRLRRSGKKSLGSGDEPLLDTGGSSNHKWGLAFSYMDRVDQPPHEAGEMVAVEVGDEYCSNAVWIDPL